MVKRQDRLAHKINQFVKNPVTNLVQGIALLVIGFSEASTTLNDDIVHHHLRVGHGLILIGTFGILGALPHLIGSIEAGGRYLEFRDLKAPPNSDPRIVPQEGDN